VAANPHRSPGSGLSGGGHAGASSAGGASTSTEQDKASNDKSAGGPKPWVVTGWLREANKKLETMHKSALRFRLKPRHESERRTSDELVVINTGKKLYDEKKNFIGYERLDKITRAMLDENGNVKKGVVHVACLWWECWEAGKQGLPPNFSSFHGANFGKLSNFNHHANKCAGCKLAIEMKGNRSLAPDEVVAGAALAQNSADAQQAAGMAREPRTANEGFTAAAAAASSTTYLVLLEYPHPRLPGLESFEALHGDFDDNVLCNGGLYKESTVNMLVLRAIISAGKQDSIVFFSTHLCDLITTAHNKALTAHKALPEGERGDCNKINLLHEEHMELLVKLTEHKGKHNNCNLLGYGLSRILYGPTPDAILAVHYEQLHYSLIAISLSGSQYGIDKVKPFHMNSCGTSHFAWATAVFQPFLITAINHALSLKVEDELTLPNGKEPLYDDLMAELQRRMSEGEFMFDSMMSVKVQSQPKGSMACGPATVFFAEQVVQACEADAFSSAAEMLTLRLQQLDIKKEAYLEKRSIYQKRLLDMSIDYQKKLPLSSAAKGPADNSDDDEEDEDEEDEDDGEAEEEEAMLEDEEDEDEEEWEQPTVTAGAGGSAKRKAPMAAGDAAPGKASGSASS